MLSHKLTEFFAVCLIVISILIVLSSIGYGLHNLAKTNPKNKVTAESSIKPSSSSHKIVTNPSSNSGDSTVNANKNLIDTGPDDSEIIVLFGLFSFSGALVHYIWRRIRLD
jgi:hypothetical protein